MILHSWRTPHNHSVLHIASNQEAPCLEVLEVEAERHGLCVAEQIRRPRRLCLPTTQGNVVKNLAANAAG